MSEVLEFKKKRYELSEELKELGDKVIANKNMDLGPARIKYVKVYPTIDKKTAGRCMLSNPMTKLFGDCDYIIQMSGNLWDKLDDERKDILMYHELLHVMPIQNAKSGNWDFKIRDHDVKDFYVIIKQYGIDWLSDLKTLFSSVYELESNDIDGFKL